MSDGTVTITTPNGLTLRCRRAPLVLRAGALFADLVYLTPLLFVLVLLPGHGGMLISGDQKLAAGAAPALDLLSAMALFFCVTFLPALRHYYHGGTPGKKKLHLRVIKENGAMPGLGDLVGRGLLRPLDLLPPFCMLALFGERLGDLAAGTRVVHVHPMTPQEVDHGRSTASVQL